MITIKSFTLSTYNCMFSCPESFLLSYWTLQLLGMKTYLLARSLEGPTLTFFLLLPLFYLPEAAILLSVSALRWFLSRLRLSPRRLSFVFSIFLLVAVVCTGLIYTGAVVSIYRVGTFSR